MRPLVASAIAAALLLLGACEKKTTMTDLAGTEVVFPDGTRIQAEYVTQKLDVMRGMMFVDSLPQDRGKLIVHGSEGRFAYFMYQTKIPLDIIWISRDRKIVEIASNTPPCPSKSASACPSFGGNVKAQYVLEINAGLAQKHRLRVGDAIDF